MIGAGVCARLPAENKTLQTRAPKTKKVRHDLLRRDCFDQRFDAFGILRHGQLSAYGSGKKGERAQQHKFFHKSEVSAG